MLDFSSFNLGGRGEVLRDTHKVAGTKLDFKKDILKEEVKKSTKELREAEPGNKIPIMNYQQLGMFCETCEDITAHVRNPEKKTIRCLRCKEIHKHL